jgi:hypothetical protein
MARVSEEECYYVCVAVPRSAGAPLRPPLHLERELHTKVQRRATAAARARIILGPRRTSIPNVARR